MSKEAKEFQIATADRIETIFRDGKQKRVLLADEVGLGKTIIAREVIDRVRQIRTPVRQGDSKPPSGGVGERVAADAVLRIVDSCDRRMTDPAVRNQGLEPAPEPDAKLVRLVVVVH